MSNKSVALWASGNAPAVPDTLSDAGQIASRALQLRDRERNQIATNFLAGNFELAASFVWMRAMALLKKQLATLGMEFIAELLQRPDIDEYSDVRTAVSDAEAISLARDLGILSPLQTLRLLQSQAVIAHFSGVENDPSSDQDEVMTQEEAVSCLRVCVQGILGQEKVSAAEDFKRFRQKLETETLTERSPEMVKLQSSPYFFMRTALSIILSLLRTSKGAQLEHAARNGLLLIPALWPRLKAPEKWQVGQVYASEFSEGKKDSVRALHAILLLVNGFDFVPENLRSSTFIQVASSVIAAHQGMNNFYNEPGPMRELANLGTSIPGPALATCMTAVLCVKLGNYFGRSNAAQTAADQVINSLSVDRWIFYISERLEQDRTILIKLTDSRPVTNWIDLIRPLDFNAGDFNHKDTAALVRATKAGDSAKVQTIAQRMLTRSVS